MVYSNSNSQLPDCVSRWSERTMGRSPCCDDNMGIKKGPWTPEEDERLVDYVNKNGHGSWRALPKLAGLNRCGKSCRLRWANYLRPDIKRGKFSDEEEKIIIKLHSVLGNKWSTIAQRLPGRTDNEIKNYWNTNLRKKLLHRGIDPVTHGPRTDHFNLLSGLPQLLAASNLSNSLNNALNFQSTDITQVAKIQLFHSLLQVLSTTPSLGSMPHQPLYNPYARTDLANLPANLFPNPTSYVSNISSLDIHQPSQLEQTTAESVGADYKLDHDHDQFRAMWSEKATGSSDGFGYDYKKSNCDQLNTVFPTEDTLPALVIDSSEYSMINEMEIFDTNTAMSKPSSSSTRFDAWGEIEGDELEDKYWKEILDQVASPAWPPMS